MIAQRHIIASVYVGLFFGVGIYLPFLPVWLAGRGYDAAFIAVALSVPLLARLCTQPLGGLIADRTGRPRLTVILYSLASALCFVAVLAAPGPWTLLAALGLASVFWQPTLPVLDAYTVARRRAIGLDYGRTRLWGSVSFIGGNVTGGLMLGAFPGDGVIWLIVAGCLACALLALPLEEAATPAGGRETVGGRLPAALLVGLGAAAMVQGAHGVLYAFSSLHWQSQGLSGGIIGTLWAVGVMAEAALFRFGTRLTARLGPARLIALGGVSGVVRFAAMGFDPPSFLLVPLQMLHAGTFACTYLGTVELVARHAPAGRGASLQALATWGGTIGVALTTLIAGPLWERAGAATFFLAAGVGGAGAVLAFLAHRLQAREN
ncbi:MFS transporter [Ancylobacter oerskovii]|uniref:MFS transporter n=1 Tax=Ancylobacter oerskovii TaxID=459519 RepID=A0ABW4Z3B3_9HYPH|nr:MFS transporter [Ancylobacter oerskovii]MBS7546065.1 MFS transporter [Ancylobacter oerskovii]